MGAYIREVDITNRRGEQTYPLDLADTKVSELLYFSTTLSMMMQYINQHMKLSEHSIYGSNSLTIHR